MVEIVFCFNLDYCLQLFSRRSGILKCLKNSFHYILCRRYAYCDIINTIIQSHGSGGHVFKYFLLVINKIKLIS